MSLRQHLATASDRVNSGLPSSDAAAAFLQGEDGSTSRLLSSTLLRSALIFPGLMVAGIDWKKSLLGAVLGSIGISTFILLYMSARNTGESPVRLAGTKGKKR
jgi:hypothetical protein